MPCRDHRGRRRRAPGGGSPLLHPLLDASVLRRGARHHDVPGQRRDGDLYARGYGVLRRSSEGRGQAVPASNSMTPAQARFLSWVSEVLVDIVVLNLFVEFVHTIVIDSFWISILTAVVLKLMVDAVKGLEHSVSAYFAAREGAVWKAVRILAVWLVL